MVWSDVLAGRFSIGEGSDWSNVAAGTFTTLKRAPSLPPSIDAEGNEGDANSVDLELYNTGDPADTWTADPGKPAWITLTGSVLSWTSAQPGEDSFAVTATNSGGSDETTINWLVHPALAAPILPPTVTVQDQEGADGSIDIESFNSGGPSDSWTLGGSPPAWVSLAGSTLSWSDAAPGQGSFTVTASNATGGSTTTVNWNIIPNLAAPILPGAVRLEGTEGDTGNYQLEGINSGGLADTWTPDGDIPRWMDIVGSTLTWTDAEAGTDTFQLTATNATGSSTTTVTWVFAAKLLPPEIPPTVDIAGEEGDSGSIDLNLYNTGGAVDTWSLDGNEPAWITLDVSTLTWTNAQPGSGSFVITATNTAGSDTSTVSWSIQPGLAPPILPPSSDLNLTEGDSGQTDLNLLNSGGAVDTWTPDGNKPAWITIAGSLMQWADAAVSAGSFDITATNTAGSDTITINYEVAQGLQPPALPDDVDIQGNEGDTGYIDLNLYNSGGAAESWQLTGSPPAWITLAGDRLSWTDAQPGNGSFGVLATNAAGSDSLTVTWTIQAGVAPPLLPATIQLRGKEGDTNTVDLNTINSGGAVETWQLTGNPAWITLDGSLITWTNAPVASGNFTITATNEAGSAVCDVDYDFIADVIAPNLPAEGTYHIVLGSIGAASLESINSGGAGTWTTDGNQPAWLQVEADGSLTWTRPPGSPLTGSFTATATNEAGADTTRVNWVTDPSTRALTNTAIIEAVMPDVGGGCVRPLLH